MIDTTNKIPWPVRRPYFIAIGASFGAIGSLIAGAGTAIILWRAGAGWLGYFFAVAAFILWLRVAVDSAKVALRTIKGIINVGITPITKSKMPW